ncbi:HAMP domain-containing sensor histidine kinase [Alkalihalobacillus sp. BA299]|uniref:sensor histidine kinase n=1 Tax=Alkalihalobacillus sp. BA299 TaxID=2815938 RepID=UPI001FFDFC3B|nr:HAMP domain-containing sensor histidine kinase [Alkalihalobacillus sp. BA299]
MKGKYNVIETLLINLFFLLLPLVIFQIFFESKPTFYNKKLIIILFSSISIILCMTFPIKLDTGFIFDLRYIPFIIAGLFGGYQVTFPLYLVLNGYRFFIGGEGVFLSLMFSTIIFIIVPSLHTKFLKFNSYKKIVTAAVVSFFTLFLYLSILSRFFDSINQEFWEMAFIFIVIHVLGIIIIMLLIEKILYNMRVRKEYLLSEKLNLASELSASVSHEIRNPLTVTSGFLQLLKNSKSLSPEEKGYIDLSLVELKRAEKIVSDYLALAKPQSENIVYSNLKEELDHVKNIITPYANIHNVNVEYNFNNPLHTKVDKNQIHQCIINLSKNGIESMKETGGTLKIYIYGENKQVIIKAEDVGRGMTEEEISRLGTAYYSTKDEGTGLEMLMVYSIVNKLGGKVTVKSHLGKGTTFLIALPVIDVLPTNG